MRFLTKNARISSRFPCSDELSVEVSLDQLGEKLLRVYAHDASDLDELYYVDAPLARLDATDEDVRTLQARRKVALRQTRPL